MKNILFRVDAGDEIGLGHFFRSVTLAENLKKMANNVIFVHRPSSFWNSLDNFQFLRVELDTTNEENHLLEIICANRIDIFYVDGMIEFSEDFIIEVRKKAVVIFYQNLSPSKRLCDIFILPSIHQDKSFFEEFCPTTKIHSGLKYFTFHKKLFELKPKEPDSHNNVRTLGVMAGGSDPKNVLLSLRKLLVNFKNRNIKFIFFYGENYLYKANIPQDEFNMIFKPYSFEQVLACDILIASFGVSTYEFMYLGMPIISVGHQRANSYASRIIAKKTGGIIDLGLIDDLDAEELEKTINNLINDNEERANLIRKSRKSINLNGISLVSEIIEQSK